MEEVIFSQEEDELDCKEIVLQKCFLQEWKIVKSLLDEIVSYGRVPDTSSVHKIRSIVLSHSLTHSNLLLNSLHFLKFIHIILY